jgi:hypothetical protein
MEELGPSPACSLSGVFWGIVGSVGWWGDGSPEAQLREAIPILNRLAEVLPVTVREGDDTVNDCVHYIPMVARDTAKPVCNCWNQLNRVPLMEIGDGTFCMAAIGTKIKKGDLDFKACALPREGEDKCHRLVHEGNTVYRADNVMDDGGTQLMIRIPLLSESNKQVFSRPTIQVNDLFNRHQMMRCCVDFLEQLVAKPIVWKCLMEHCFCSSRNDHVIRDIVIGLLSKVPQNQTETTGKRDNPSTPSRSTNPAEDVSPLPTQNAKRRSRIDANETAKSYASAAGAQPFNLPPRKPSDTGPKLTPLGKAGGTNAKDPITVEDASDEEGDTKPPAKDDPPVDMFPETRGRSESRPSTSTRSKSVDRKTPANKKGTSFVAGTDLSTGKTQQRRAIVREAKAAGVAPPSKPFLASHTTLLWFSIVVKGGGLTAREQILNAISASLKLMRE